MLFEDTYKTIKKNSEGIYKEKGSKFIALAYPVQSEDDVKEILIGLRKEYHDARHHCYAYRLGHDHSAYRVNDDGEPSGTAGKPIFGQIRSFDLTNILIVVIRYFGGTKLGVSGLINAYKSSAKEAIEANKIIELTVNDIYEIHFGYPLMNDVMSIMKEENLEQISSDFQLDCKIVFPVRKSNSNKVFDKFSKLHGLKITFLRTE